MSWVVLKYGGTSVSSAATWKAIHDRAEQILVQEDCNVWITVSAVSQVTNKLIQSLSPNEEGKAAYEWIIQRHEQLQKDLNLTDEEVAPVKALLKDLGRLLEGVQLTGEITPRIRARVCSLGELCSSLMGKAYLKREFKNRNENVQVCRVDARKLLVATCRGDTHDETRFLEADVMPRSAPEEAMTEIKNELGNDYMGSKKNIVITQGFIASTVLSGQSHTCLLGRGGSDTSGALFAAFLKAKRCEIWTDVYGLFTCDPRLVPEARLIREMSYREAQELAAMGAKVLHPRCIGPCQWAGVPLEVRNTMDPEGSDRGILTRVCLHPEEGAATGKPRVVAVTKRTDQILLTVQNFDMWGTSGFLSKVFTPVGAMGIGVDLIATSEYSVSMTLDQVPGGFRGPVLARLVEDLQLLVPRGTVTVEERCVIVSIVGRRLRHALPSLAKAFKCMKGYDVRMVTESAEDLNLSFVVADPNSIPGYIDALVAKLHRSLFKFEEEEEEEVGQEDHVEDVDESLGASWDELRAKNGPTPRPLPTSSHTPSKKMGLVMTTSPQSYSFFHSDDSVVMSLTGDWKSPIGLQEIDRMWNLSPYSQTAFLVVDYQTLKNLKAPTNVQPRFRISDLGKINKQAIIALSLAGFGILCETIEMVKTVISCLGSRRSVVPILFSPNHPASAEEYSMAASLGCQEIALDDEDAIANCPNCDIYTITSKTFHLKQRRGSTTVRENTRVARWDALFQSNTNELPIKVVGGEIAIEAVGLVSVVTRVNNGNKIRVLNGPNPYQVETFGLNVLNCSNPSSNTFKDGDIVVFFQTKPTTSSTAWWLSVRN